MLILNADCRKFHTTNNKYGYCIDPLLIISDPNSITKTKKKYITSKFGKAT